MSRNRSAYLGGVATAALLQALGALGGALWIATHGRAAGSIAVGCGLMVLATALGEAVGWRMTPVRLRRVESLARRAHRIGFVALAGLVMVMIDGLGAPTGLLAGVGDGAPAYLPLPLALGMSPATIVTWARYVAAVFTAVVVAAVLVAAMVWWLWQTAAPHEIARLRLGRELTAVQVLAGVVGLPLLAAIAAAVAPEAGTGWLLAVATFGLGSAAVLADLPFRLAGMAPRGRTEEERLRTRCGLLMLVGLVAASTLGGLVWRAVGAGIGAALAGLVVMVAVLAGTSLAFWRLSHAWPASEAARPIDRPEWVTHLFVVALFLYPLGWAKDTELFQVSRLADLVWSPRIALTAAMAAVAAALLYALQTWLRRIDQRPSAP